MQLVEGINTLFWIQKDQVPSDKKVTYTRTVWAAWPNKEEKNYVQFTGSGDVCIETAGLETSKFLYNSVISTKGGKSCPLISKTCISTLILRISNTWNSTSTWFPRRWSPLQYSQQSDIGWLAVLWNLWSHLRIERSRKVSQHWIIDSSSNRRLQTLCIHSRPLHTFQSRYNLFTYCWWLRSKMHHQRGRWSSHYLFYKNIPHHHWLDRKVTHRNNTWMGLQHHTPQQIGLSIIARIRQRCTHWI